MFDLILDIDITNWLSNGLEKVLGAVRLTLNLVGYFLSTVIYKLLIYLYNLFEMLCKAELLSGNEFSELAKRIGYILGIIMLFRVVFSFIQMLVNPDSINDKDNGAVAIIKKCIIVVVMLGVSNFVFSFLHNAQTIVIEKNIISRLLLPKVVDTDNFGAILSEQVFMNFYTLNEHAKGTVMYDHCSNYKDALSNSIIESSDFEFGYNCLNETETVKLDKNGVLQDQEVLVVDFNPLSVIVGAAFVWIIFRYCISVGIRLVQLTVLEIISPMPIISYISPKKDNMFSKWIKLYTSTYIDVFIRVAIINFMVYLCAVILDNWETSTGIFWGSLGGVVNDPVQKGFVAIIMILALLTFANNAPKLLGELLPSSASKIGFGVGLKDVVGLQQGVGMVAGAAGGAAVGILSHRPLGVVGGLLKGGAGGFKSKGVANAFSTGWKAQSKANEEIKNVRANGGNWLGHQIAKYQQSIGVGTAAEGYEKAKSRLEVENAAYKSFDSYIDAAEKRAEAQILKGEFNSDINAQEALRQKSLVEIYRQQSANIKRENFSADEEGQRLYEAELNALAEKSSEAESEYLKSMKKAKKAFISSVLNGGIVDEPTLQNLQQAAGIIDANSSNNYDGFKIYDDSGEVIGKASGEALLKGTYEDFDTVNSGAKKVQSKNNTSLAKNQTQGRSARANARK